MSDWRLSLFQPQLGSEEEEAVLRVLRRGWLASGPEVEALECEFAQATGSPFALAVSSCTAALLLSCLTLDLQPGDEVIVPALTWGTTAHAVVHAGGRPIFADSVSAAIPLLDPADVRRRLTRRTRAVICVHYAGFACDLAPLLQLCHDEGLILIEDCAHSPLARTLLADGREVSLGTTGQTGCFSFYSAKNMTCGEGGMLTLKDAALVERIRMLRGHGVMRNAWNRRLGIVDPVAISPGLNFQLDDLRAAIARVQLARLTEGNSRRRKLFAELQQGLVDVPGITPCFQGVDLNRATPHLFPVLPTDTARPWREALARKKIQTGCHYPLLPGTPCYQDPAWQTRWLPLQEIFSLPFHLGMKDADVEYLLTSVRHSAARIVKK